MSATVSLTLNNITHAQATAILAYLSGNLGGKGKAEPAATPASEPTPKAKPAAVEKKAPESAPAKTTGGDEPRAQAKKSETATVEPKTAGRGKKVTCSLDPLDTSAGTKCWSFKFRAGQEITLPKGWHTDDKDGITDAYVQTKNVTSDEYETRREQLGAALAAAGVKKVEWVEEDADLMEVITAPDADDADDAVDG